MESSMLKYDKLHRYHNPGSTFAQSEHHLEFPSTTQTTSDRALKYHLASKTEKVYSPFQNNYYLPPHLNSSKTYGLIFKGECSGWKIRQNNLGVGGKENRKNKQIKDRHVWNATTNYDVQYRTYEERVKLLPGRKYELIEPRIKYLIEQDRPGKTNRSAGLEMEENEQNM